MVNVSIVVYTVYEDIKAIKHIDRRVYFIVY